MRSITPTARASSSFAGSALVLVASAALAEHFEPDLRTDAFWWLFIAIQIAWLLGYLASSLPRWGKWLDGVADTEYKLAIVAGVLCALLAGNIAYYLGYYELHLKRLYCIFAAIGGGFLGEKYLTPLFQRLMPAPKTTGEADGKP
jgi:MFS family permease